MAKKVAILGSTGSIGKSALDVLARLHPRFEVWGLSANTNFEALAAQAIATDAPNLSLSDPNARKSLADHAPELSDRLLPPDIFDERAAQEADIVLVAVVGAAGLSGSLAAAKAGKRLALANKESLVAGGGLVMAAARESGAEVIPVDSEHSALFQALASGKPDEISQIVITASGGPFLDRPAASFDSITPKEALDHPTWSMGQKITIDSATMANKAFEVIEAHWLFDVPAEKIAVLVHPESIVHSMVRFADESVLAQLSLPDMRLPIQYAFTYPERVPSGLEPLDLASLSSLSFREPDMEKFPCLALGFEVAKEGGTLGAVANAANEIAVEAFLRGALSFTGIYRVIRTVLDRHDKKTIDCLATVLEADAWARREAENCL